jgi:hypothetical protein
MSAWVTVYRAVQVTASRGASVTGLPGQSIADITPVPVRSVSWTVTPVSVTSPALTTRNE